MLKRDIGVASPFHLTDFKGEAEIQPWWQTTSIGEFDGMNLF
jgi:hypothetical protein